MDSEQRIAQLEVKFEELLEIAEENNEMLRYLKRTTRWSFWGRLLIWIIVLVLPFLLLGPLLKALVPGISGQSTSLFGLPSQDQVKSLLNAYKQGTGTPQQ